MQYSILPALTTEGIIALDIFEGSVTKERFLTFIQEQVVHMPVYLMEWTRFSDSLVPTTEPISTEAECGYP